MITINDYAATRLEVCDECATDACFESGKIGRNEFLGLDSDPETGEILEPGFGKFPCDLCGERLAGHRFGATLLTKTTTVKGEI